nr:MAG TPA: hypothetical protein [Caudoviricetes sp.]
MAIWACFLPFLKIRNGIFCGFFAKNFDSVKTRKMLVVGISYHN